MVFPSVNLSAKIHVWKIPDLLFFFDLITSKSNMEATDRKKNTRP